jgi:hypothetical protein
MEPYNVSGRHLTALTVTMTIEFFYCFSLATSPRTTTIDQDRPDQPFPPPRERWNPPR